MGEWFNFNFRFEHRKDSMSQLLIDDGIAVFDVDDWGKEYLKIDIQKLSPTVYDEINKENIAKGSPLDEFFCINYENDGLQHYSKWVMNDTIVKSISQYFLDDVIYVHCDYSGGADEYSYFIKNGKLCLRDGTPSQASIGRIKPNLITSLPNDTYQVVLPIGEGNDKWGTFTITKNNIEYCSGVYNGVVVPYYQEVVLDDTICVSFKSGDKIYTAKELADAYYESKNAYRNQMNEPVFLENLDMLYIKKRTDEYGSPYFIARIPCSQEISEDESISISVSVFDMTHPVNKSLCNICLGIVGKERPVQIVKNNKHTRITMKPVDIVKHYKETLEA